MHQMKVTDCAIIRGEKKPNYGLGMDGEKMVDICRAIAAKVKTDCAAGSLVFDITGLVYSENLGDFITEKVRECKKITRDHPIRHFLSTCP